MECGAHLLSLRRTASGPFSLDAATELGTLEQSSGDAPALDAFLLPTDAALTALPSVLLDEDSADFVTRGNKVRLAEQLRQGIVRMYGPAEIFLGIGEITGDGFVAPRRIMCGSQKNTEKKGENP